MLVRDWLTKRCPAQLWAWRRYPGALGFFKLEPGLGLARPIGLAGLIEYDATVTGQVFAVTDARLGLAQQLGERGFPLEQGQLARVVAVDRQQVERIGVGAGRR